MNRTTNLLSIGLFFAGIGLLLTSYYQLGVLTPEREAKADAAEALPYESSVALDMALNTEVMLTGVVEAPASPRPCWMPICAYHSRRFTAVSSGMMRMLNSACAPF